LIIYLTTFPLVDRRAEIAWGNSSDRERLMNYEVAKKTPHWYAIYTRPKQERRTEKNLRAWQVETFNPMLKVHRTDSLPNKPTYIVKPLFPRYIFAKFVAADMLNKIRFTRGVRGIVSIGAHPAQIDEAIIFTIMSRMGQDGFVKIGEEIKLGDRIRITTGVLKDFTGIFERETEDATRVMILLTTITYQLHLVVDREILAKAS
jgi:transcriptional antiterminator RfaH